ncbi:hypothetical protein FOZ62_027625 [Perkinsus olseni]|uniref:Uncharacterized protein n=1 Tax=Perkinsus olseni TaxID=32597 RepID=A0A7J6RHG7_PEROL|nr:hypothetical protein FOZ62_027625 [Perkinsus olseni]
MLRVSTRQRATTGHKRSAVVDKIEPFTFRVAAQRAPTEPTDLVTQCAQMIACKRNSRRNGNNVTQNDICADNKK